MKALFNILFLLMGFIISNNLSAQQGRGIKQPPKINGITKAINNANINAKIHANSNSVFGTANTHPNYNKKEQPKNSEIKDGNETKKSKVKKEKK